MMSQNFCDPCAYASKSSVAVRYCSDCLENLCKECSEFHVRYEEFKGHTFIDLLSAGSKLPSTKKYCELHENGILEFVCINHDTLCCRKCVPEIHKTCDNVLPLEDASKDVKNSSLFIDTINELSDITKTLQLLSTNRTNNLRRLQQTQVEILKQIDDVKERIMKNIEALENKLKNGLESIMNNNEQKIERERNEIENMKKKMIENKQKLEFLTEHGSNNQLFLALKQHADKVKRSGDQIQEMTSTYREIGVTFEELTSDIKTIGSISETGQPCTVQYKPTKILQAQVQPDVRKPIRKFKLEGKLDQIQPDVRKPITEFKLEGKLDQIQPDMRKPITEFKLDGELDQVQLDVSHPFTEFKLEGKLDLKKSGEYYVLTDIVVTADNALLLCNYGNSKIYVYKDCKCYDKEASLSSQPFGIALLNGTEEAVVTLPLEKSIQFINIVNMVKGKKLPVGFSCYGVTTSDKNIFVGGLTELLILAENGSIIKKLTVGGLHIIQYLHKYDKEKNQILCRGRDKMKCIDMNGRLIYQVDVSGTSGLAVDHHGNVFLGGHFTGDIRRLSPDGKSPDVVLTRNDGLNYPHGMTFNEDYSKLYVINDSYQSVQIYRYK